MVLFLTGACSSNSTNAAGAGGSGGTWGSVSPPDGCLDGTDDQVYAADMVGCSGQLNQCAAYTLCASGWHLCTHEEYAVRGGKDVIATQARWLQSCVREYGQAGVTSCPSKSTCNPCDTTAAAAEPTTWNCAGAVEDQLGGTGIGVFADTEGIRRKPGCANVECTYPGVMEALSAAGAMCCK